MWVDKRSDEKEMMDYGTKYCTPLEYNDALMKLSWINSLLGGFRGTKRAFKKIKEPHSILEVGCGGGYLSQKLYQWFLKADIVGIDIDPLAIDHAVRELPEVCKAKVSFHPQPDKTLRYPDNSFDVVTTMLVCHHMTDPELVEFLQESYRVAAKAVIINDLQRHFLAYFSFSLIGKLFRNRLIWNDGRISIKRGFRKKEWISLLEKAGFNKSQFTLHWDWAFRFTLTLRKP